MQMVYTFVNISLLFFHFDLLSDIHRILRLTTFLISELRAVYFLALPRSLLIYFRPELNLFRLLNREVSVYRIDRSVQ